jgi:MHS family shikimate/dehydroshikimate transporter-like MFS transporter
MRRPAELCAQSVAARAAQSGAYRVAGIASLIGTTIEWYDFFLYGTAAALLFNRLFFPNFDALVGTLAAFTTYAFGFVARPFGGIVFGHFGDRIGRKSMLLVTLLLMGIPTTLIGLIPTYQRIGAWAPALLVVLRCLQGIAIGGEWGGAALMAVEHAPAGRKGLFGSLPQAGVGVGLVLSSLAMAWVSRLSDAALLDWGWRLPFLASIALVGVGVFVRLRVAESPVFETLKTARQELRAPVLAVLRHAPLVTLRMMGVRLAEVTWFYTIVTFSLAYAVNQGDRVGQKWLCALGALGVAVFAFPFFALLQTRNPAFIWLAIVPALGLIHALIYGQEATLFAVHFPPAMRYSGISLVVQLPGAVGGGLAPIIATAFLALEHGATRALSLYLLILAVIAGGCAATLPRPAED